MQNRYAKYRLGTQEEEDKPYTIKGPPIAPEIQQDRQLDVARGYQDLSRGNVQAQGDILSNEDRRLQIDDARDKPRRDAFNEFTGLGDKYRADPVIRTYEAAVPLYGAALSTPATPEGDLALVNAYAKINDPLTGVQQREGAAVEEAGPRLEAAINAAKREFGWAGGFSDEARKRLRDAVRSRMQNLNQAYIPRRQYWENYIKESGANADPAAILGAHAGKPFQDEEAGFIGRPVNQMDAQGNILSYREELRRALTGPGSPDEKMARAQQVAQRFQQPFNHQDAMGAIQGGGGIRFEEDPSLAVKPNQPGFIEGLRGGAQNAIAGIGQGLSAIPDAFVNAAGYGMGAIADSIPGVPEWASDRLKNPLTIGGMIERAAPTPQDSAGQGVRLTSQIAGGVAGFPQRAANAVTQGMFGRVPQTVRPPMPDAATAARAAEDLGIDMPRFVAGGPTSQRFASAMDQTPFGAPVIKRGTERMLSQSQGARDRIAGNAGTVLDDVALGESAQAGAKAFTARTSQRGGDLYAKAERLSQGATVRPVSSIQALDQNIAELAQTPGGAEGLKVLQGLRDELAGGSFGVQGIRNMRSALRDKFIKDGLRGSDLERRVNQVIDAASEDIVTSLKVQGKEGAAKAYQLADRYWRQRIASIDETLAPIIGNGNKTSEEVARAITSQSRSNGARMGRFIRALPEQEAADVRATLISQLGRSNSGAQNAAGDAFSLDTFLTHWDKIRGTRGMLFDQSTVQSLNKLALVAERAKAAGRARNSSNTGGALVGAGMVAAGGGGVALSASDPTAGASGLLMLTAAALGQRFGANLLASPKFAQHLARIPVNTSNPASARAWAKGFSSVSKASPGLAAQIDEFQRALMNGLNDNVSAPNALVASPYERPDDQQQYPY